MPAADAGSRVIYLIRHGRTEGNIRQQFFGKTEYPLLDEEKERLRVEMKVRKMPRIGALYVSPMIRCRETAEILFPGVPQRVVPDLREMDFGTCEGKTSEELSGTPFFEAFIASGGQTQFPEGESMASFTARVTEAFYGILGELLRKEEDSLPAAFVIHGGTIMGLMASFAQPRRGYFEWSVHNNEGFRCVLSVREDGTVQLTQITPWKIGDP